MNREPWLGNVSVETVPITSRSLTSLHRLPATIPKNLRSQLSRLNTDS